MVDRGSVELNEHTRTWWFWFTIALLLLLPADLVMTVGAVAIYGVAAEANPVMRWLLHEGLTTLVLAHLLIGGLAVGMFQGVIRAIHRSPVSLQAALGRGVTVWLGFMLAAGLLSSTNNVLVLVSGYSLPDLMQVTAAAV